MALSSDESRLRDYKLRKVSKLVRRCRTKNIKFDKKYVDLSYELTTSPETMTMADIEALRVECTEGLGSDYCSTDSDSDNEIKRQMRRKKKPGLLIADYNQSNPYNRSCVVGNSETKPIFNSRGFQFGIISPPQRRRLNLGVGTSQELMSFAQTMNQGQYDIDFCCPSLSSCSSPDTSSSLVNSPLFSTTDNLSFQVSKFITSYLNISHIYPISLSY